MALFRALRMRFVSFFFFQAEDGIRDLTVTGVQTCALPIFHGLDTEARRERRQGERQHDCRAVGVGDDEAGAGPRLPPPVEQREMLGVHLGNEQRYRLIRSEEHTSELQSQSNLVCRLLLEKKKKKKTTSNSQKYRSTTSHQIIASRGAPRVHWSTRYDGITSVTGYTRLALTRRHHPHVDR